MRCMRHFLLHLISEAKSLLAPTSSYDEALSLNVLADCAQPVVRNQLLLGTLTQTEAVPEGSDDD